MDGKQEEESEEKRDNRNNRRCALVTVFHDNDLFFQLQKIWMSGFSRPFCVMLTSEQTQASVRTASTC